MDPTPEQLRALPKAELHVHLDGSLRPQTLLELARDRGIVLPAYDATSLAEHMHVTDARDLVDYLARFEITLNVMQTEAELERIARELAEDMAAEGVWYAEVRYCPALNTREGLTPGRTIEATLRGLGAARRSHGIRCTVIVCALRNQPPATSVELAELAASFRGRGVVGFDLAGPEHGHPPVDHIRAFRIAAEAGLGVTIHAGEAYGRASVREAIHACGARRLGHGTRLVEDPVLLQYVNDFRIPVEVCLTSNVQTRVARDYGTHPFGQMFYEGLVLTLCTDNRLMSATTVSAEYLHARDAFGLTGQELASIARMGFEAAFLPRAEKMALLEEVDAAIGRWG